MKKSNLLIIHSTPFLLGILLSYLFWQSNILLLFIYIIATVITILAGKDKKAESWVLLYGLIIGFLVETIGTHISGYQSFTKPEILSIPYWIIVVWGYAFVLMKRINFIIVFGTPWGRKK